MNYVIAAGLVLCLGAGAFMVARSPAFWISLAAQISAVLIPSLRQIITKRMTQEQEAAYHACVRRGGEWDNFKKRCREK